MWQGTVGWGLWGCCCLATGPHELEKGHRMRPWQLEPRKQDCLARCSDTQLFFQVQVGPVILVVADVVGMVEEDATACSLGLQQMERNMGHSHLHQGLESRAVQLGAQTHTCDIYFYGTLIKMFHIFDRHIMSYSQIGMDRHGM